MLKSTSLLVLVISLLKMVEFSRQYGEKGMMDQFCLASVSLWDLHPCWLGGSAGKAGLQPGTTGQMKAK